MRRRAPGLRRRLAVTLVGVALVSVLLLSAVIYLFASVLINDGVRSQIESVRDTRIEAINTGVLRLQSQVASLAANPSVVDAMVDLSDEFGALDETVSPDQVTGLADLYQEEVLPRFVAAGIDVDVSALVPASPAGQYIQQQYIVENPNDYDNRDLLDDAGDGSSYSAAHAEHHPVLRELLGNTPMSDLLLLDVDTGEVVYTTEKRIDLGTNGIDGPYAADGLGSVLDTLSSAAVGDAVMSDSFFYIPTRGQPVFFVAAAIRSSADVVGVIVTEVPVDGLTAVMTAQQDWTRLGLGNTGESYVVGADGTLRSDSRLWIEDSDEYLRRYVDRYDDQNRADLIEAVGSPVLLQVVDNEAVEAALDDEEFIGTVTNYLGKETLAAAGPAGVDGVDWAVVVEVDKDETDSALNSLLRRMLWVLALLLPTIGLVGVLLARILTRPADTLVGVAARIADGDLDSEVPDLGRNELGDLGRQLDGVAHQLESRDQTILDEERNINDMLMALLPDRLIDRVRSGEDSIEDIFDTATVVSITVDGAPEGIGADQDLALEIADRMEEVLQDLMDHHGVERIHRSAGSQLYLTGLDQDDARVGDAADFVLAAIAKVAEVGAEFGQPLSARSGMSAGDVATGVLGSNQLSFGVWGDPTDAAVTLGSLARPGEALADDSVAGVLGDTWDIDVVDGLAGLDDDTTAFVLNGRIGR
ncbi:HAMP domain-containing protein [Ilumatobacter sp.]|uniref:HAMP domain-containing protein n=1 Tax=Ilumatobacter sp. TaxID=1967498 RepID=UPI003C5F6464